MLIYTSKLETSVSAKSSSSAGLLTFLPPMAVRGGDKGLTVACCARVIAVGLAVLAAESLPGRADLSGGGRCAVTIEG